ncbi:MAG: type I secretion C-terminal target domain-containing protein, partial [Candidatus Methylumidiphilus sp.]
LDGGALDAYAAVTDTLDGGAGNDTFLARGFYGHGVYDGGDGTDIIDFSQSTAYTAQRRVAEGAGVKVDLAAGLASNYYLAQSNYTWTDFNGQTALNNIENVVGSSQADRLLGDAAANRLEGGAGADILSGGLGADTFKYGAVSDSDIAAALRDVIQDFSTAQGDKIDLSALDADSGVAADQAFSVFAQGAAFSGSFAAQASLFFDQTAHVLYGNNDADAQADFAIELVGVSSLTAAAFVL